MAVPEWVAWTLHHSSARTLARTTLIQTLWGGYGELLRLHLEGGPYPSAILKRVLPPVHAGTSASDRRKRRSYEVELAWYGGASDLCDQRCRVARCLAAEITPEGALLLLEDLGAVGFFPRRPPRKEHLGAGLRWLAQLHSLYLGYSPPGLWEQGSYWHLETRQEEWERMPPGPLKEAAGALDARLRSARFQTVVHGDAKPSNFCWSDSAGAAAVDFQYVGPGCGVRDVAYFLDSCLDEDGCAAQGQEWLDLYFVELRRALCDNGHAAQAEAVEEEWRALYPVAWSDFQRFYQGWGRPGPLRDYSRRQLDLALRLP